MWTLYHYQNSKGHSYNFRYDTIPQMRNLSWSVPA